MPPQHDLVVLPVGPAAVLHRARAGRVEAIAELGPWSRATHRISRLGTRIASLVGERLIERELRGHEIVTVHERAAPKRVGDRGDMGYLGERLFLAGLFQQDDREVPLLEATPGATDYTVLPVPEETEWKWVDVLVPYGERLIAVDDCTWPRWIYDYVFTPEPTVRCVAELVLKTPNGNAEAAVMCAGWLCIFEHSMHMGGNSSSIALYARDDLTVRREYRAHLDWNGRLAMSRAGLQPVNTIASDGDRLWVASGESGIGVADLRGLRDASPVAGEGMWRLLARRAVPELQYRDAPKGRFVVDLATVPGAPGCFALLAEDRMDAPTEFVWYPAPPEPIT